MPSRIFPGRSERPDWNRPLCHERNRFPRHAYLVQFPNQQDCEEAVENNRRYLSPSVHLLNGRWDFKLFEAIQQMPENIFAYRSGFDSIEVPSTWDIAKLLRRRSPRNRDYGGSPASAVIGDERTDWPFPLNLSLVPEDNPVGIYHRSVELPKSWNHVRKRLVFHSVQSAYHLVINGRVAGYAQYGRMTHEFDVTNLVHDGINEIFVLVYPFCIGSYLDGSTNFQRPGILGDVYFESVAPVSVFDLVLETIQKNIGNPNDWQLNVKATVLSYKVSHEQLRLRICLKKDGQTLIEHDSTITHAEELKPQFDKSVQRVAYARLAIDLTDILPWSDESPELYDLFLTCLDPAGNELSSVHHGFGFRQLSWENGCFHLNFKPRLLMAINYQLHDEAQSSVWSLSGVVRDLRLIKQQHFNTIRLQGGPVDPIFYELCNSFGLYVIADHTSLPIREWRGICDSGESARWTDEPWLQITKDRVICQVLRDRNQTCLIAWSADPMDDSRVCELIQQTAQRDDHGRPIARYFASCPEQAWLEGILLWQPDIALSHGGSAGLSDTISKSRSVTACSGLICGHWDDVRSLAHSRHDQKLASALSTIRQAYPPLSVHPVEIREGRFLLKSELQDLSLDHYRLHWQIKRNGVMVIAGELDCPDVPPLSAISISIDYGPIHFEPADHYTLHLTAHQIAASLWLAADAIVWIGNFLIISAASARDPFLNALSPVIPVGKHRLRMDQDRHLLVISGHRFWLVFNRITAMLESWRCGDHELLSFAQTTQASHRGSFGSPLIFARQAYVQDLAFQADWQRYGLEHLLQTVDHVDFGCDGHQAEIQVTSRFGPPGKIPSILAKTRYRIQENGQIELELDIALKGNLRPLDLPRIGFRLVLRRQYDQIVWSGQGPDPSWPGNPTQCYTGRFSRSLLELMPAAQSQVLVSAPHDQTIWAACVDAKGFGLLCESPRPFVFQARDFLLEDLLDHHAEPRSIHQNLIEFCIDAHFRPVGQKKDVLRPVNPADDHFHCQFVLTPVNGL